MEAKLMSISCHYTTIALQERPISLGRPAICGQLSVFPSRRLLTADRRSLYSPSVDARSCMVLRHSAHNSETQKKRSLLRRMYIVHGFFLLILLLFVARLLELQVMRGEEYRVIRLDSVILSFPHE